MLRSRLGRLFGGDRSDAGRKSSPRTFSLFYASDVHGSERCWRKFINAGRFYGVDALVMGGDLTGKAIVPIERLEETRWQTQFLGEQRSIRSHQGLSELLEAIRINGMYPWIASRDELDELERDPERRARLFDTVLHKEIVRWVRIADERLAGGGTPLYVMAGNDDPWLVDQALQDGAGSLHFCDDRVVRVGPYEMLSSSYANPTPWDSPRELSEEELYARIKRLAEQLEAPDTAIFNLHVPPYDSGLDLAPQLGEDFTVKSVAGAPVESPVGSKAVRELIAEYQPLLALHGHIHESPGVTEIGRTTCINPGSQYNSGRIHGAIVQLQLSPGRVSHQLIVG